MAAGVAGSNLRKALLLASVTVWLVGCSGQSMKVENVAGLEAQQAVQTSWEQAATATVARTDTPVPPTATGEPTHTAVPPTLTAQPTATEAATHTPVPPTATRPPTAMPTIAPPTATIPPDWISCAYIGNKNSMKFHRASCVSVKQMKESNKVCLTSRDEAIAAGYVPCGNCKP